MYADGTSILNMGINPKELKIVTSTNKRHVTQYLNKIIYTPT